MTTDTPGKGEPQLGNYPCLFALWAFLCVVGWSLLMWEGPACCEQHHPQASGPGLYEKVRCLPPNNRVFCSFPFYKDLFYFYLCVYEHVGQKRTLDTLELESR